MGDGVAPAPQQLDYEAPQMTGYVRLEGVQRHGPWRHAQPAALFVCPRPAGEEESCAKKILTPCTARVSDGH